MKEKMKNIEENLKINSEAIQWIISALRDNSIIPKISPNPGNKPHNYFGFQIFWLPNILEFFFNFDFFSVHIKSRTISYPGGTQHRLQVPDHLVSWTVR